MSKLRVLVADDQPMARLGLKALLELTTDRIEVVGTAANGEEALAEAASLGPEIVLMDLRMPVMDGINATRLIKERFPAIKVVAMTTYDDDESVAEALRAGADGYLLKDIPGDEFVRSLFSIRDGGAVMSPGVAQKVMRMATRQGKPKKALLAPAAVGDAGIPPREMEVLRMMAKGFSNEEIAKALFISLGTVRNYISRIYARLDARDRTQAVLIAVKRGLVRQ